MLRSGFLCSLDGFVAIARCGAFGLDFRVFFLLIVGRSLQPLLLGLRRRLGLAVLGGDPCRRLQGHVLEGWRVGMELSDVLLQAVGGDEGRVAVLAAVGTLTSVLKDENEEGLA